MSDNVSRKWAKVMGEFKRGTLTSHGKKVTDPAQARAIAHSYEERLKKKRRKKGRKGQLGDMLSKHY